MLRPVFLVSFDICWEDVFGSGGEDEFLSKERLATGVDSLEALVPWLYLGVGDADDPGLQESNLSPVFVLDLLARDTAELVWMDSIAREECVHFLDALVAVLAGIKDHGCPAYSGQGKGGR